MAGIGQPISATPEAARDADHAMTQLTELTTVADDMAVFHIGTRVVRHLNLEPDTEYTEHGITFRTLSRPTGALLCSFATVNDVHFGETECGRIDSNPGGPIQRSVDGERPYPLIMNEGAVAEIVSINPAVVVVKGDLSVDGRPEEFAAFDQCYYNIFADRLCVVRGNHDAYRGQNSYAGDQWIELSGISIALMDTAIPTETTGRLEPTQLEWLEALSARSTNPVIVMGHHQQWTGGKRSDNYFGLHPDSSDELSAIIDRNPSIVAYTAGHTHRHRVRRLPSGVPTIEIGCVKDFPGTWAEYRVYEGGITQVVHRISSPEALNWSERCRHLYTDFGIDYETYALGTLSERCFNIDLRS